MTTPVLPDDHQPTLSGSGIVHGNVITLDQPLVALDGKRVRVVIAPIEDTDLALDPNAQTRLWKDWVQRGPKGPIEDDDAGFP
jgi:hypothetical protein